MIAFFARLQEGDQAYRHLLGWLREDTESNLLTFSLGGIAGALQNIFAIDGNSAATGGIAEMLLQSHGGEIELLPALPKAWASGSVKGLKARGNLIVHADWRDGKVVAFAIRSPNPSPVRVRVNGVLQTTDPKP